MKQKTTKLAPTLELEMLTAVVRGAASPSIVDPKELGKIGRLVHSAIITLAQAGLSAPYKLSSIFTHCISNLGAPKEETRDFLREIQRMYKERDQHVLLKVARQKEALVGLLNEASKQLGSGVVELRKFNEIVEKQQDAGEKPKSLAELHRDYKGEPEPGINIASLPSISECAKGIQGVWVIGGAPGEGKSTLGLQIAIELGMSECPVLYYDLDGTGEQWVCYRITQAVGAGIFEDAARNIHYREYVDSLDSDLLLFPPPALVVIDSIQTLPLHVLHRRSSLDQWMTTFKRIAKKGYVVLLISEVNRDSYGEIKMGAYKESGGIEYAGALCGLMQATDPASENSPIEFHILKNRHGPRKGHVATLERNAQRPFWLEEI